MRRPDANQKRRKSEHLKLEEPLLSLGSTGGSSFRLVEFLLGPGSDFIEFRVQPSNLAIKLDEAQTRNRQQLLGLNSGVVLHPARFQVHTRRGLLRPGIALQVQEIET